MTSHIIRPPGLGTVLAGRSALLGYLRAGQFPRQFALAPGGGTLYVTNYLSGQLESIAVGAMP